ncbi:fungal specific transcription factor domain-containing protein [Sporothrix schenckii 1099-18]|uniref:Fungal specific transcription factor domain-containing protein n=1 Tax=Sporothrix schenckii 1099-18 TaxID=1397361 RepID=A0A0F2LTL1_SPOSC|nr:fungal specific transcription factor domain-containing protein [Sporothrix schenckii 1099-18]KJR79860.1 fungal specific transcription factor domain-containing protein [Sporothrix schenckii 1099-18]
MASADEAKLSHSDDNDIHNQENVSARGSASRSIKQQVRHRASVACASCRDRRIRCVVPKGEAECTQCKRAGTECIIKNDDERRRPISKAYMSSLSDRIQLLESMLVDRGVEPPPAVHPPKTRQDTAGSKAGGQTSADEGLSNSQQVLAAGFAQQQQQQQQQQLQQEAAAQQAAVQQAAAARSQFQQQLIATTSPDLLAPTPQAQQFVSNQLPSNISNGQPALSSDGSPSRDNTSPPESSADIQTDDFNMHESEHLDTSLSGPVAAAASAAAAAVNAAGFQHGLQQQHQFHNSHAHATSSQLASSHSSSHTAPHTSTMLTGGVFNKETSPFRNLDPKKEDIVQRLLSTKGNLSFDQLSGRLRFFGPTANSHVYAETSDSVDSREPPEQVRRSERIIRSLTSTTHDYLMNCFWNHYNAIIYVIDREAFEASRESQNPKFYTSFLHITVLAMGYRFSDRGREDIKKISLGNRESTLQREAKYMLDIELERPGGIPSVQALLLLGDLECGVGRDNTGWMYSGMANRLAFDIGLHLDYRSTGMNEKEVDIRHMVMKAAIVIDKYWALFLGRPTSIKSQDIGMDLLTKRFSLMVSFPTEDNSADGVGGNRDARPAKMSNEEIYEYLFELMELAGKIVETRDMHNLNTGNNNTNAGQNSTNAFGGASGYGGDVRNNASASSFATIMPFAGGTGAGRNGNSGTLPQVGASDNVFALDESEENAYLHVISLDRQLQNWYRRLPDHLTWKPANVKAAPMSFFLLHQQYHVSMILLHRPWAKYGSILSSDGSSTNSHPSPSSPSAGGGNVAANRRDSFSSNTTGSHAGGMTVAQQQQHMYNGIAGQGSHAMAASHSVLGLGDPQCIVDDSRTTLSRSICTQQAIRVARIFWQHRQRFDGRRICITGIQHAGTAAIALIAALAYQQSSDSDRRSYLGYLEILSYALTDMSHTYQPASRMDDLLKAVLEQLRSDVYGPDYAAAMAVATSAGNNSNSSNNNNGRPGSVSSSAAYGSELGSATSLGAGGSSGWYGPGNVGAGSGGNMNGFTGTTLVQAASGAPSGSNGIDVYSVLPARRENPDADALQSFKKRRPPPSRRASEFTRPPPPFFSQHTPPGPNGAPGGGGGFPTTPSTTAAATAAASAAAAAAAASAAIHHPGNSHHHNVQGVHSQQQLHAAQNQMMTNFFSAGTPGGSGAASDRGGPFGLDFLNGSDIDLDGFEDRNDATGLLRGTGLDDYVLVQPGTSDSWALNGNTHHNQQPQQPQQHHIQHHHHSQSHGAFDMPMADWTVGPSAVTTRPVASAAGVKPIASLSASSTRGGNAVGIGAALDAERKAAASAAGLRSNNNTNTTTTSSPNNSTNTAPPPNNGGPSPATIGTDTLDSVSVSGVKNRASFDSLRPQMDIRNNSSAVGEDEHGNKNNLDWMEADVPLDALSPVSLSGLVVQTVEKTMGDDNRNNGDDGRNTDDAGGNTGDPGSIAGHDDDRNHDLDFFSF